MPREAMFYAYTRNSAHAMNLDSIGTIAAGKRADLVLLDRDVLTVSPEDMRETKVLWTMVAGRRYIGQSEGWPEHPRIGVYRTGLLRCLLFTIQFFAIQHHLIEGVGSDSQRNRDRAYRSGTGFRPARARRSPNLHGW